MRRYGRQRKKENLKEIEELKQQVAKLREADIMNKGLLSSIQRDKAVLQAQLERVAYVLGEHFIALDAKVSSLIYCGYPIRLPKSHRFDYFSTLPAANLAMQVERLLELGTYEPHLDMNSLLDCVHMFMMTPKGKMAYSISNEALHNTPIDFVKEHVSQALARTIVKEFDRNGL